MRNIIVRALVSVICLGFSGPASSQSFESQQLILSVEKLAHFKHILADMKSGCHDARAAEPSLIRS